MVVMSFFDTSLVKSGAGRLRRLRQLRRGAEQPGLLVVDVAHRLVHHPHHAAAGRPGVRVRAAGRPGPARALVLPAGVLPAVHPAVGRGRADLDLALHPGAGPARPSVVTAPGLRGAELAGQPRPGDVVAGLRPRSGGRSASTSCSTWPACRTSRGTCTRRRRWTAPARGSRSAGSPSRCSARTTSLVVVLQIIASLKLFDQMYIMTSGGPNFAPARCWNTSTTGLHQLPHRLRRRRVDAVLHRRARRVRRVGVPHPPPGTGASDHDHSRRRPGRSTVPRPTVTQAAHRPPGQVVQRVCAGVLIAFALIWLVPIAWTVDTALKPNAETTNPTWAIHNPTLASFRTLLAVGRHLELVRLQLHHLHGHRGRRPC